MKEGSTGLRNILGTRGLLDKDIVKITITRFQVQEGTEEWRCILHLKGY